MKAIAVCAAFTLTALPAATAGSAPTTFVEDFETGGNEGVWSWYTGNETISPLNGHPGAYLEDVTLFSCCPAAGTAFGVESTFTGDYRSMGVTSVGIDIINLDVSFGVGGRPLTVMLFNDNGTPFNFDDDWGAYFIGDVDIPDPGVPLITPPGWAEFDFEIPAQATSPPAGWQVFGSSGGDTWNDVMADVDVLQFFYGDPTQLFLFLSWDVGMDNPRITSEPAGVPADINGDGTVDAADLALLLGAWGENPGSPADLNGDGVVNASDLAQLLGSWG